VNRPTNPLLEDAAPPQEPVVERLKSLSRGEMVMLVAADFHAQGTATSPLDGWDAWGLLIALTSLALISAVVVVYATDVEIADDIRWELWILVAAAALFAMTLVKNLTDANSAWASYFGVLLAGAVLYGAFLDWAPTRQGRRFKSRTRSSPGPS
jgi:predicted membrane channel-forming protein YqfA (hemolysin III family)